MHIYPHGDHTGNRRNEDGSWTAFRFDDDDNLIELHTGTLLECERACDRAENDIRAEADDERLAQFYDWRIE